MAMRGFVVTAVLAACGGGGKQFPDRPPPLPIDAAVAEPDAMVAVVAPPVDAPPPPPPAKPFDVDTLPSLAPVKADPKAEPSPVITVYAADADGDTLLRAINAKTSYAFPTTKKRVTGRLYAPKGWDAFHAIAQLIGADVTPVTTKGKGAVVSVDFTAAPFVDLARIVVEAGKANIVVAPGTWPVLTVHFDRVPWDVALGVMIQRAGLTLQREGSAYYAVPAGTKLPARGKAAGPPLDFDAKDATVAQLVTGIRALTKLELGSCAATRINLRAKRVAPNELVRMLEVGSGEKLASADACESAPLGEQPVDKLKLVAIVAAGTKRVAVFDQDGKIVIATSDDKEHIKTIGQDYVEFSSGLVRPLRTGAATSGEDDDDEWLASLKRVLALVGHDEDWGALIESGTFTMIADGNTRVTGMDGIGFKVDVHGVRVVRDTGTELRAMTLTPP